MAWRQGSWPRRGLVSATALALASAVVAGVPCAVLAVDSPDFGVLYIGEYDDADAKAVRDRFAIEGWNQEVFKTSRARSSSLWPAHYHFTHGPDDRQTEAGDDCDFLYVSGHGYSRAKFPIFRRGVANPVDSISPDISCTNDSPWEVGVDWKGRFPSNESRWDHDLEWAVFAACSQLDWRTPPTKPYAYSATWPRNSAAKTWARTLLGEPGRMHAILGYWGTAPAGSTDTAIIRRFMDAAFEDETTVVTAWMRANQAYGMPWAAITHAENRSDRLHGVGTGPTPDTSPRAAYHIDYYRNGETSRLIDGRGGSYEEMASRGDGGGESCETGQSSGPGESGTGSMRSAVVGFLDRLLGTGRVLAAPPVRELPEQVKGNGVVLDVTADAVGGGRPIGARRVMPARPLVSRLLPGKGVAMPVPSRTSSSQPEARARGRRRGSDGQETAARWADGRFAYHSGRRPGERGAHTDRSRAAAQARTYAIDAGLSGIADATIDVRPVIRARLDLDEAFLGTPGADTSASDLGRVGTGMTRAETQTVETIAHEVRLTQSLDGVPIDGPGVGLTVVVDEAGVCDAYGLWFDAEGASVPATARRPEPARRALAALAEHGASRLKLPERVRVEAARLVYTPRSRGKAPGKGGNGTLRPAWSFALDDGAMVLVDAATLEILD